MTCYKSQDHRWTLNRIVFFFFSESDDLLLSDSKQQHCITFPSALSDPPNKQHFFFKTRLAHSVRGSDSFFAGSLAHRRVCRMKTMLSLFIIYLRRTYFSEKNIAKYCTRSVGKFIHHFSNRSVWHGQWENVTILLKKKTDSTGWVTDLSAFVN